MSKNKVEEVNIDKSIKKALKENIGLITTEVAKGITETLKANNLVKREMSYYKRVEILLYNLENLREAAKQKDEDIEYIDKHGLPEKSKSIVSFSSAL